MIEVKNLRKEFKQNRADAGLLRMLFGRVPSETVTALEDVTFNVEEGEFYSLLGRNGAGKTTTIKVICTLLLADSGTVTVGGHDVERESSSVRAMLGVSIRGERSVYWRLSGRQNLAYFGRLYDVKGAALRNRIEEIGEIVGLSERLDDYVERYSMGMKQRLAIGCALIHRPRVLLLDEPTIGLDAASARDFRDFISHELRARENVTILYTTHYMHEAEEMSDRIGIVNHGRIVAEGTPSKIIGMVPGNSVVTIDAKNAVNIDLSTLSALDSIERVHAESLDSGSSKIRIEAVVGTEVPVADVVHRLTSLGAEIGNLSVSRPTLEDAFLRLTAD
ncbi:MAG: ABC transporter ATP-binding protein [Chloroflexi bacterium]|nr:ABC transporter ATP-binding protein [Chloroflexota bacterium]